MYHVHKDMGLKFMLDKLNDLRDISYGILFKSDCEIDYNVIMVLKIIKNRQ
jgi:hypothetical protein